MLSVQAAGWGGGSLIYVNVFARPSDETFRPHWPVSYSRASLDRYFDLAAHMLEIRPLKADPVSGEVPVRTRAMEDLVERMDRAAGTVGPNLAVRFAAEPNVPQPNRHGVLQHGCTFVGECVVGCNQGAKNSLDYNYLAVAVRAGAVVLTEAEVVRIEPGDGGYAVEYRDHAAGGVKRVLRGQSLFLAAGAVRTTELLLRSRDVHKTLPDLLRPDSTPPGTPPPRVAAETERSDGYGQVHDHRGLYVVDGAAVPNATGVNPSASILAMAERNVERAIRSMLGDQRWEAPEMPDVTPAEVPEDHAMLLMSIQRRQRSGNGVRFHATMTGSLRVSGAHIAGWRNFIHDPNHPISLSEPSIARDLPPPARPPAHSSSFPIPEMSPCDTGCTPHKTTA